MEADLTLIFYTSSASLQLPCLDQLPVRQAWQSGFLDTLDTEGIPPAKDVGLGGRERRRKRSIAESFRKDLSAIRLRILRHQNQVRDHVPLA